MIREDQGEVAIVVEQDPDTDEVRIVNVFEPKDNTFTSEQLKATFVQATIDAKEMEDAHATKVFMQYMGLLNEDDPGNHEYKGKQVMLQGAGRILPKENSYEQVFAQDERPGSKPKIKGVSTGKKYKPVDQKVKPALAYSPEELRVERYEVGDPLEGMKDIPKNPPEWKPAGRYTQERREEMVKKHFPAGMTPTEGRILDWIISECDKAFAWEEKERGTFRTDAFPPVRIATVPHTPWREKNRPIAPGLYDRICEMIKAKLDAGVYEPSNSSYTSRWFCVLKKDNSSLRIVHSLEPLNAVTIAHSGVPPATEDLAAKFAGRSVGGTLDLYVGYDERLIHPESRDLTTFQTPFGALRLVTLPMGWTNSVPIFHDDVTFILRPEMPSNVCVYIDDVGLGGPKTRYEDAEGVPATLEGAPDIRRYMWEYFHILYRVLLRMQFYGGTFSGKKSVLVADEFTIVGHVCSYAGRKPNPDRLALISNWAKCEDVSDVRSFLGLVGTLRIFIKNYAKRAEPIQKLTRNEVPFEWGPEQAAAMSDLQQALKDAPILKPIDHERVCALKLSVDTSYKAIGWYLSVLDEKDQKTWHYARFGSMIMSDREARYSQSKRELFGLLRALDENRYLLLGARKLIVESDAKYLKGMLENPMKAPNATVHRWIESILLYRFTLQHVAGKEFALADSLSRRPLQPNDEPTKPFDHSEEEHDGLLGYVKLNADDPDPLDIDDFKDEIDNRKGYLQTELQLVNIEVLPDEELKLDQTEPYPEDQRTEWAKREDERLEEVRAWLKPPWVKPQGFTQKRYEDLVAKARSYFLQDGKLYKRSVEGRNRVVVPKENRMYIMRALHDALGHRGSYATRELILRRFWWPDIEKDVHWYVTTCEPCQKRQKTLLKIPPTVTDTPPIFQVLHADVVQMSVPSNGCNYIVHGRCSTCQWMEGRPLRKQDAPSIGRWLWEEIITRWGCLLVIVTDNAGPFVKAVAWLKEKYGIHGITISAYNSKANGSIERPHFDVVNMLSKLCEGDLRKWFWFFPHIMWADRVTIRKRFGCAPFFLVTGAEPILPLDIQEATWLTGAPTGFTSTEELLVARAKALAKHRDFVESVRERIHDSKRARVAKYEEEHKATIKDYDFKPGDLVLMRNTAIESSLNRKLKPRYVGPMVVIHRNKGGAYIIAEMDGTVYGSPVGAFRLVPFHARRKITLPKKIHDVIDLGPVELEKLSKKTTDSAPLPDVAFKGMPKSRPEENDEEYSGSESGDV